MLLPAHRLVGHAPMVVVASSCSSSGSSRRCSCGVLLREPWHHPTTTYSLELVQQLERCKLLLDLCCHSGRCRLLLLLESSGMLLLLSVVCQHEL
jgi:hypothetical protein